MEKLDIYTIIICQRMEYATHCEYEYECDVVVHRVTKENRAAGILENFDEGQRYSQHGFRKFIDGKSPEIMPSVNSFFADPK